MFIIIGIVYLLIGIIRIGYDLIQPPYNQPGYVYEKRFDLMILYVVIWPIFMLITYDFYYLWQSIKKTNSNEIQNIPKKEPTGMGRLSVIENQIKHDTNVINSSTDEFFNIFNHYHKTLKCTLRGISFEKACKLELALFLLFRADFMLQKSDHPMTRQVFFEKIIRDLIPDIETGLLDLCYQRIEIYGEIYNDCKDKKLGIFSKEFLEASYNWLISAIKLCEDDYYKMASKRYIPMSTSLITDQPIKICLQELDINNAKKFIWYVKGIACTI